MSEIVLPNMREQQHYGLDLSHDDRALLEKKASTENLLNGAAQQTGKIRKDEHIDVHGDDASFREVKDGQQPWAEPVHTGAGSRDVGQARRSRRAREGPLRPPRARRALPRRAHQIFRG